MDFCSIAEMHGLILFYKIEAKGTELYFHIRNSFI